MVQCRNVIRISLAPERTEFADAAKSLTGERESIYGRAGDELKTRLSSVRQRPRVSQLGSSCVLELFLKRTRCWPMPEHSETLRDTVHAALFGNCRYKNRVGPVLLGEIGFMCVVGVWVG